MRTPISSYSFNPRLRAVTLTGSPDATVDLAKLGSITDLTTGAVLYLPSDAANVTVSGKTVTLPYGAVPPTCDATDELRILYGTLPIPGLTATTLVDTLGYTPENVAHKSQANGYAGLDGGGKVPLAHLPSAIMTYQGVWNAATNNPTLADGVGDLGDVWRVATAGSRNLGSGAIDFQVGDYAIYNGTAWEKSDTTDAVASVAGLTGVITSSPLKTALALNNVDNTSDANKPVSSATQTALDGKAALSHTHAQSDITGLTTALTGKEPTIEAGTTSQYWRGDKSWRTLDKSAVGLGNVDNTSDANKSVASAAKLTTARAINGVLFDGSADITVVTDRSDGTATC